MLHVLGGRSCESTGWHIDEGVDVASSQGFRRHRLFPSIYTFSPSLVHFFPVTRFSGKDLLAVLVADDSITHTIIIIVVFLLLFGLLLLKSKHYRISFPPPWLLFLIIAHTFFPTIFILSHHLGVGVGVCVHILNLSVKIATKEEKFLNL